jgi:hypothetical protein
MMAALLSSKIGKHGTPCDMLTRRAPPPIMAAVSAAILLMSRSRASSTRRLILGMLFLDLTWSVPLWSPLSTGESKKKGETAGAISLCLRSAVRSGTSAAFGLVHVVVCLPPAFA